MKKIISVVLVVLITFTIMPFSAFAADNDNDYLRGCSISFGNEKFWSGEWGEMVDDKEIIIETTIDLEMPNYFNQCDLTPNLSDRDNASYKIYSSGTLVSNNTPYTVDMPSSDTLSFRVEVTAQNGQTRDYTVNVTRAAAKNEGEAFNITLSRDYNSEGSYDFEFLSYRNRYDINVDYWQTVTHFAVYPMDEMTTYEIYCNGELLASNEKTTADLLVGTNIVEVILTSQTEKKKTYTYLIHRDDSDSLLDLGIEAQSLMTPFYTEHGFSRFQYSHLWPFDEHDLNQSFIVPNRIENITNNVYPSEDDATVVWKKNGGTYNWGLDVGLNTFTFEVSHPDVSYTKTYKVEVTRKAQDDTNANLANMSIFGNPIDGFDPDTIVYDFYNASSSSVSVKPLVEDSNATFQVFKDGELVSTNAETYVSLNTSPLPTAITVVVTAGNGTTTKTYTVNVKRVSSTAALNELYIHNRNSQNDYWFNIQDGVFTYSVDTAYIDNTVYIEAFYNRYDKNAKLIVYNALDQVVWNSSMGDLWKTDLALNVGLNTFRLEVIAEDGVTKNDYTLNINRNSAPSANNADINNGIVWMNRDKDFITSDNYNYEFSVDNKIHPIEMHYTLKNSNATSSVYLNGILVADYEAGSGGVSLNNLPLNEGTNTLLVEVIAQDGVTTNTYTFVINRTVSTLQYIDIVKVPVKVEYHTGDQLDLDGLAVRSNYESGYFEMLDDGDVIASGYDSGTTGTQTITITYQSKAATFDVDVIQSVPVTAVSLNKSTTSVAVGSTDILTETVTPADATNKNVTWSSDDEGIATVADGVVTGVSVGTATISVETENGGYTDTCFVTVKHFSGAGTELDPYLIKSADDLATLSTLVGNGTKFTDTYFLLTSNIDMSAETSEGGAYYNDGAGWLPIGLDEEYPFDGNFNGDGHVIIGLHQNISGGYSRYGGLFGYIHIGTIENLGMVGSDINVSDCDHIVVGGIVGRIDLGTIRNCYNTGSVSAIATSSSEVGGIVGSLEDTGALSDCFNTGQVESTCVGNTSRAGGIAGVAGVWTLDNCYNTGEIISNDLDNVGAILGYNYQGTANNCYYLDQMPKGIGNEPDTTVAVSYAQLSQQESFAGFDFSTIWTMGGNTTYAFPELQSAPILGTYVTSITVTSNGDTVVKNNTLQMSVTILPANADDKGYTWSVENGTGEATIDEGGLLTGTKVGTVTVKATALDGSVVYCEKTITITIFNGQGTEESPYLITNKEQLNQVRNYLSAHFRMENDIVFTEADFEEGGDFCNNGAGWQPIGFDSTITNAFTGTFDGNGQVIIGLYCNISNTEDEHIYVGLFGFNVGVIKNLGFENANILVDTSEYAYVGSIAGSNIGDIISCYSTGNVCATFTSLEFVGGIAGENTGSVYNCYNSGSVSSSYTAGGIVGLNLGEIDNCYNSGGVSVSSYLHIGDINAGGISGSDFGNGFSSISNCYNIGSVLAFLSYEGGIASAGGIVGNTSESQIVAITNCYYLDINSSGVGYGIGEATELSLQEMQSQVSFVGFNFDTIWTMDGNTTYAFPELQTVNMVGTYVTSITVTSNSDDVVINDTLQMNASVLPVDADDTSYTWSVENGTGEAVIDKDGLLTGTKAGIVTVKATALDGSGVYGEKTITITTFQGQGTEESPYLITNKEQLNEVRNYPSAHFRMKNDIVFSEADFMEGGKFYNDGQGWKPIGTSSAPFGGVFDGNGYAIKRLYQSISGNGTKHGGLFGYVSSGTVKNVGLEDGQISVNSSDDSVFAGSIAGYVVNGDINCCYNTGDVSSVSYDLSYNFKSYSGGIVGYASGSAISNCYNAGKVDSCSGNYGSDMHAGGIAGYVDSSQIVSCYNIGSASSSQYAGGIVGLEENCTFSNCYYLNRISLGIGYGEDIAISLSSTQLTQQSTLIGFDFDTIWTMDGDVSYPYPKLQGMEMQFNMGVPSLDFADGSGSPFDPYQIETIEHLNNVRNYLDAYYVLNNDIIFTSADFSEGGPFYNNGSGFIPIGTRANPFAGVLDGGGHKIKGLYVNIINDSANAYAGLFGYISGGSVQKLSMEESNISIGGVNNHYRFAGSITGDMISGTITNCYNTGSINSVGDFACYAGGIAGNASNSVIEGCQNSGNVISKYRAGGIVGSCNGTINNCNNTGSIDSHAPGSYNYAGGIAGEMNGTVSNSNNKGDINGSCNDPNQSVSYVGGIVGWAATGMFQNCYNTGSINSSSTGDSGSYAGGIAGYSRSNEISESYNIGNINAGIYGNAGGIAGYMEHDGSISDCYNTGTISSINTAGGIVGHMYDCIISNCYNRANIFTTSGYGYIGGIVGLSRAGTVEKCYNSGSVSGSSSYFSAGGILGEANDTLVTCCYNFGRISMGISGTNYVGGIVGKVSYGSGITDCYNAGIINKNGDSSSYAGGFAGKLDSGTISDSYYLNNISRGVGTGTDTTISVNRVQLTQQATFVGFDFETIWTMDGNETFSFPELQELPTVGTFVTSIMVTSASDMVVKTETLQMNASILPDDVDDKTVTWSVVNGTGEATIDENGLLTAIEAGTVTIKAITNDGSCMVSSKEITIIKVTDVNRDTMVDLLDLAMVAQNYGVKEADAEFVSAYDINKDGIINLFDLILISKEID